MRKEHNIVILIIFIIFISFVSNNENKNKSILFSNKQEEKFILTQKMKVYLYHLDDYILNKEELSQEDIKFIINTASVYEKLLRNNQDVSADLQRLSSFLESYLRYPDSMTIDELHNEVLLINNNIREKYQLD